MSIKVFNRTQGVEIPVKTLTFPGGERHVKCDISTGDARDQYTVSLKFHGSDDLIDLTMIRDILRHKKVHLQMDYVPFARQDRRVNPDEPHALRVFANLINSLDFETISCVDPHSNVVEAVFPNIYITCQLQAFLDATRPEVRKHITHIVAPDAGAEKKAATIANWLSLPLITFSKVRDKNTGEVVGISCSSDIPPTGNFLVVDDICDGGRTFIEIGKYFNTCTQAELSLYVTHGIFSKGLGVLAEYYSQVHFYNDMRKENT